MARHVQIPVDIRAGLGEVEGLQGERVIRLMLPPELVEYFRDHQDDPRFPISSVLGRTVVYANGQIVSDVRASAGGGVVPAPAAPTDLQRVEQLRLETGRLEARHVSLSGQVTVDERRLASVQAELAQLEARVVAERTRTAEIVRTCDEEIERVRKAAADEKAQIREDLREFRTSMAAARKDHAEMFENLRIAEVEEARAIGKRRVLGQHQLTASIEEFGELEDKALRSAIASGARPTAADQAAKMGITLPGLVEGALEVIDRIKGNARPE